jgi:hypothetical protein
MRLRCPESCAERYQCKQPRAVTGLSGPQKHSLLYPEGFDSDTPKSNGQQSGAVMHEVVTNHRFRGLCGNLFTGTCITACVAMLPNIAGKRMRNNRSRPNGPEKLKICSSLGGCLRALVAASVRRSSQQYLPILPAAYGKAEIILDTEYGIWSIQTHDCLVQKM